MPPAPITAAARQTSVTAASQPLQKINCATTLKVEPKLYPRFTLFDGENDCHLRVAVIIRQLSEHRAPLPLPPTSVLYKIDLGEAPFSLQTMRNETHKKARWRSATEKKEGETEREREGEGEGG